MDPALVIFAIRSGIRLGSRINEVLITRTVQAPLYLPLGDVAKQTGAQAARDFFDLKANRHLTAKGGPYHGLKDEDLAAAHQTLKLVHKRLTDDHDGKEPGDESLSGSETTELIEKLHQFEQTTATDNPATQQIFGTIVEIGIDYFSVNPNLLKGDSNAEKIIRAFVPHLSTIDFAGDPPRELVGSLFLASLKILDSDPALLDDDKRVQALVKGITSSLIEDFEHLGVDAAADDRRAIRERTVKRIASSIFRGGVSAFSGSIDLFIQGEGRTEELVKSTLSQFVVAIEGKEDLFTNRSLELLFTSALNATSENSHILANNAVLQQIIEGTIDELVSDQHRFFIQEGTIGAILRVGMEAVGEHAETLIDPTSPERNLVSETVRAVANGLSEGLENGGTVAHILSKNQLLELFSLAFSEVAKDPARLLGDTADGQKAALAQIVGSLATALGSDPRKLVTGEGFLSLIRTTLITTMRNADKLLDLNDQDVRTNIAFQVIREVSETIQNHADPRKLVSREVFLSLTQRVLETASTNVGTLTAGKIGSTVTSILDLASGDLQNRINGGNLPILVEAALKKALRGTLDPEDTLAIKQEVTTFMAA